MGFVVDLILIAIIAISTFLGYKKGLVKLGAKLFAGIIAIVVTLIIFKPVSNIIINNTGIDEKIQNVILEKASNVIENNSKISDNNYIQEATDNATNQVKQEILPEQAKNISANIIYAIAAIAIFVLVKIGLSIIISLADVVASLPILKEFNKIGGILYGFIRGALIVCVFILLAGVIIKVNSNNYIKEQIDSTYLTKIIYQNIVKF